MKAIKALREQLSRWQASGLVLDFKVTKVTRRSQSNLSEILA